MRDAFHVGLRKSPSVVRYGYFHVCIRLHGLHFHPATFRRVLTGILHQRVYHEKRQRLVCLDPSRCGLYVERLPFGVKSLAPFCQDGKKFIKGKSLNVQAQRALPHLYPQSQYLVVFVDTGRQLVDVTILSTFQVVTLQVAEGRQLMHLVDDTVDIGDDACDDRHTGSLDHVLTFVFDDMLFVDILFFFQLPIFPVQHGKVARIADGMHPVRTDSIQQSTFVFRQTADRFQPHPVFLFHYRETASKQTFTVGLHRVQQTSRHVGFVGTGLWHSRQQLPAKSQCLFQFLHMQCIVAPPAPVEHDKHESHKQHAGYHHRQPDFQPGRLALQPFETALKLLVLARHVENVQINVTVVVRLLFHAQAGISNAELFADAGYPFGHGLHFAALHPAQFERDAVVLRESLEVVHRVGASIVVVMMERHIVERTLERIDSLGISSASDETRAQRAISTGYLVNVSVGTEKLQCPAGQPCRQQRVGHVFGVENLPQGRAAATKHIHPAGIGKRLGKGLQAVGFKIDIAGPVGQAAAQIVELLHGDFFRIRPRAKPS